MKLIREAFGKCETTLRCRSREHIRDGEYKDIERLIGLIDDLKLHGATTDGLLGIGHALNMAIERSVFIGTGAPTETAPESFAVESLVQGETDAAVARALDTPKSLGSIHAAIEAINRHISALVRKRLVFQREAREAQGIAR